MSDRVIADILGRYAEPFAGNVWRVQSNAVIYHKTLERIAAKAGVVWDPPHIVRAERDEAVILVTGRIRSVDSDSVSPAEWSLGEAVVNVNYRVSPKQAAYVYAMAEKRGKDRVILKLIGLHGLVYSEDEADDFGSGRPAEPQETAVASNNRTMHQAIETGVAVAHGDGEIRPDASLARKLEQIRAKVDTCKQAETITRLMSSEDAQAVLRALGDEDAQELRTYAWARMRALKAEAYASAKSGG